MKASYDILIAGAGPAGSALAIELGGEGYSVLLMDAARFPRDKPCGDYVSPRGLARLDALGCGAAIRRLGSTPIRASRLYLNREELVSGTLPKVAGLPAHGLALPRRELDEILFRRALASGAEGRESCRVKGFEQVPGGIEAIATWNGEPHRVRGKLLIGADGATSAVARAAGLGMTDPRHTLASLRAYVEGPSLDHTIMYFDERYFPGYGWVFPVRPGLCNIGVGMVTEPMTKHKIRLLDFHQKLERLVLRLGRSQGVTVTLGPHRGWPIHSYGAAGKNCFERGLLIGEAGGFVDPINGEGIPLAMESARIAARTIRAAFARGAFDEISLARYERDFRAHFDPDLDISDLAVSLIRNRYLLPVWLASFRAMSHTARQDETYAAITGGILGGVLPARRGITPEMFVRTLARGPAVLGQALHERGPKTWNDLISSVQSFAHWQSSVRRALVEDGPWLRAWAEEIAAKQRKVGARALRGMLASQV
ncbi:MAG: geranylgeranyl reductase family protein [Byssovorax sp.]